MWLYLIAAVIIYLVLEKLLRLPTVGKYGERYVFITGCDTGFGNLLAKRLDSLGFNVFAGCLTERGADELRKRASAKLQTVDIDVTKVESIYTTKMKVEKLLPVGKGLWAIVNNAGIMGPLGPTELLSREDYLRCLNVNLFGLIDVTKIFLPLVRREKGRVINMSSVAGRLAFTSPAYPVSKYGVEAFSDCLRREVYSQGIGVHIIEPAAFKTQIYNVDSEISKRESVFNNSSKEIKNFYGKGYMEQVKTMMDDVQTYLASSNNSLVIDAYSHVITARYPRYRYPVGEDMWYWKLMWNLPEFLSDRVLSKDLPEPEGAQ